MEKLKKLLVSPFHIYGLSFVIFIVILLIGIPALNLGNKGQAPFSDIMLAFIGYAVTIFFISIVTSVVYWQWFKKYSYVNIIVAGGSGYFIDIYLLGGLFAN